MAKAQFLAGIISLTILSACAQEVKNGTKEKEVETKEAKVESNDEDPYADPHQYGGWYCPDNFGFEPVDIKNLDEVPVVKGRMPEKWETQSGIALMYLDPEKFPQAKALDIELPALAYVKHPYADFKELAIIIQAFVADEDTIVGYRFPNGGNGSAWFRQIDLLSPDEVAALESTPFFFEEITIDATKEKVWKTFTQSDFAKDLRKQFKEKKMTQSEWTDNLTINLEYKKNDDSGSGYVANVFGNLYMQIDYIIDDRHSSYKFIVSEDFDAGTATITFLAGPYPSNLEEESAIWQKFMEELKKSGGC